MWQKSSANCSQVPGKAVKKLNQMWNSVFLSFKTSLCNRISWEPTSTMSPWECCRTMGKGWGFQSMEAFSCNSKDSAVPLVPLSPWDKFPAVLEGSLIGGFSYFVPVLSKGRLGPGSAENCSGFSHPETAKRQTHPDTKKVKHWGRTQGRPAGMPALLPNVKSSATPHRQEVTQRNIRHHANNSHQAGSVSSPKRCWK